MKRIEFETRTRQIIIIPTFAILRLSTGYYNDCKFRYRIALGWLCFLISIGIFKISQGNKK